MSLKNALTTLNGLVEKRVIDSYAIGGGYAVMYHNVTLSTYDLDILVILQNEASYHELYEYFRKSGNKIEDVYIYIDDMPVQFLPNYISPLYNSAVITADELDIGGVKGRVVSLEHLIALLLTSYRPKDKIRIKQLLSKANKKSLSSILRKFNNDSNKLLKRYKEVLGGT